MKTLQSITIVITILLIATANAQITKGNWMVGGSGSFSSGKSESKTKATGDISRGSGYGFSLQPNLGYFVADKFVVGLTPTLGFNKNNDNSDSGNWGYGIGSFVRYYLLNAENRVNILTHVSYQYALNSSSDNNYSGFVTKVGPVVYFNSSVALEMTLNYQVDTFNNNFSVSTFKNFDVRLGFQIHLEK